MEPPSNLALVPGHVQAGGPWMTAVVVLAGLVGHYFGRDLRNGLTQEL